MDLTRREKAKWNMVTYAVLEVVNVINGLVLPRLVLGAYGSAYNGITSSAAQFLNLISILTIGVTASTRVALYKSLADLDIEKTSSIVCATEKYMRRIGMILGIYILLLAFFYPLAVNTGFSFWEVSSLIIIIGLSSFAEYFFGITNRTLLLADQRVYVSNLFSIVTVILNLALSVLLIKAGYSIQLVKLGSSAIFVLKPFLQNLYVKRYYKINSHCTPDFTALKNRSNVMMHTLANIVHDKVPLVVLTVFTNIKIVSVYTIYNLVMASLTKAQSVFTRGTEPIFGNMWAKGEIDSIRRGLSVYEFMMSFFSSVAYSVCYVMILPFIALYTNNVHDVNYIRPLYSAVLVFSFVIYSLRTPYLALVQGVGAYKETRWAAVTEAAINLCLSVLLVLVIQDIEYKMMGVAIATFAANLFRTIQYAIYIDNHIIRRGKYVFVAKILWTLANMGVVIVSAQCFIHQFFAISTWKIWIICSLGVIIFSFIVTFFSSFLFYRSDLKYALSVARTMVLRKKRK